MNNLEKKIYEYFMSKYFNPKKPEKIAKNIAEIVEKDYEFKCSECDIYKQNSALKKQLSVMKGIIETLEHDVKFWKDKSRGIAYKPITRERIVCLCGSTKFKEAFEKANKEETLKGNIVLSVGAFPHCEGDWITKKQKEFVDKLHLAKIDLADEILILNINGYVGNSTRNEINYAKSKGKKIRFLEGKELSR